MAGINEEQIFRAACRILDDNELYNKMAHTANPYGDGRASDRIVEAILHWAGMGELPEEFE
jgi:UDP-N-acetylglucosamine 2-epimerase (non-hydrolysing)